MCSFKENPFDRKNKYTAICMNFSALGSLQATVRHKALTCPLSETRCLNRLRIHLNRQIIIGQAEAEGL